MQDAPLLIGVQFAGVHRGGAPLGVDEALVASQLDEPDADARENALDADARLMHDHQELRPELKPS